MMKKLLLVILFALLIFSLFSKEACAFSTSSVKGGYQVGFENAVFKSTEMNLQSFVNETVKATVGSIISSSIGCLSCNASERQKNPGFVLSLGNFVDGVYSNPPASGMAYVASIGNKFIGQPVYAQETGQGFKMLDSILPVWKGFRNASYALFVLMMLFMGFAIMFRVKISPQAVITVQAALPKIIMALILITFSYAIVGFMLDLMIVLIALINTLFIGTNGIIPSAIPALQEKLQNQDQFISTFSKDPIVQTFVGSGVFFFFTTLNALFAALVLGPVAWLFAIIAIVLIIIAILRVVWTIIKSYAMIIVHLIFAPFEIMIGVLPGSNAISGWFKSLLSNIIVLPAVYAMFFVSTYLILKGLNQIFEKDALVTILAGWGNPIGTSILSVKMATDYTYAWQFYSIITLPFIGIAILLLTPKISDIIASFMSGKPFGYGAALGEGVAAPGAMVGAGIGYASKGLNFADQIEKRFSKDKAPEKEIRGVVGGNQTVKLSSAPEPANADQSADGSY